MIVNSVVGDCVCEVDWHIFSNYILSLGIKSNSLLLIILHPGFFQNSVNFRVAVLLGVRPNYTFLGIVTKVCTVHANHWITPVEHYIHSHVKFPGRDTFCPGWEIR